MNTRTSARRALAIGASGALACALAWLPAGPASAAVAAQSEAEGQADTSADCTLTSGDDFVESGVSSFSSGTKKHSVNLDAGFTATGDPTDTVNMNGHFSTTAKVAKKNGDLTKASVTGKGNVSIDAAKGGTSVCEPTALVAGVAALEFTEHKAGWFYIKRHTVPKAGLGVAVVVNGNTGNNVVLDLFQGNASDGVARGFAKSGTYQSQIIVGLTAGNFPPILFKAAQQSSMALEFHKAGSALAGTKGSGKAYVEFPGSVSCGNHKATLRWKSSAGKVAGGAFFVNGNKKASDSTPQGGEKIVLKHLKPKADIKITAKLQLKGGGSATATRAYVPCKG
jgi:hypothetical protein